MMSKFTGGVILLSSLSLMMMVNVICGQEVQYLYGNNHYPVKEYTGDTNDYKSIFEASQRPRIVEFYSPHCPHCITFKPVYMKLAKDIKAQFQSVEFYAVSCDHHDNVCKEFEITGYPTMFAFPPGVGKNGKQLVKEQDQTTKRIANLLKLQSSAVPMTVESKSLRRRMDDVVGDDDNVASSNAGGDDDNVASSGNAGDDDQAPNSGNADDDQDQPLDIPDDDQEQNNQDDDQQMNQDDDQQNQYDDDQEQNQDDDEQRNQYDDDQQQNQDDDEQQNQYDDDQQQNQDDDEQQNQYDDEQQQDDDQQQYNVDDDAQNDGDDNEKDRNFEFVPQPQHDQYRPVFNGIPTTQQFDRRRPGAGAAMARTSYKDVNRFKEELKLRQQEYDKKRTGVGKLLRKDGRKDKKGQPIVKTHPDAMTKTMKVHTPGTQEYKERKAKVMKRIEKAKKDVPVPLTKENLPYKKDVRKETFVKKTIEKLPLVKRIVKLTPEEELILDVSSSLVAILETGTYLGVKPLEQLPMKKKTILKDFLDLLNISLPPEWGIHKLIHDLRRRHGYIVLTDQNLRNVMSRHPLPRRGWSDSCTRGTSRSSGFSCGLWKLFHVATVGVAEQRGGLSLVESGMVDSTSTKLFSPIEAADTIASFIEHFFSCKSCAKHFSEHYEDCENNRRCDRLTEELDDASTADWKELPLWMWEVHNDVSIHVVRQRVERANKLLLGGTGNVKATRRATPMEEVSAIWPNVESCILCFEDDGTWDEPEVFNLLERTYWPDADLDPRSDKLLKFEGESGFMSALFLWIVVFAIVYAVYSVVMKNSSSINQSVLMARQMMQSSAAVVAPKKKERTN